MDLNNYLLAGLTPPAVRGGAIEEWIQVYNNTASAMPNGVPWNITYLVDITAAVSPVSSATNPAIFAIPIAPATNTTGANLIGVIDNVQEVVAGSPSTLYAGIPAYNLGWAKTKGVCQAEVDGTADVAIGDTLKLINAGVAFIESQSASSGATPKLNANDSAISLVTYTTNSAALKYVHLIGRRCDIAAS